MKWESGAPIYRIRFKDGKKSEVTIHALKGEVLLYPSGKKEIKKIAQDFHTFQFLPENLKWILDVFAGIVIFTIVTGMIIFFMGKKLCGTRARKIHIICCIIICIPFLIMSITGIFLNHEEWLESKSKINASAQPTGKPSLDFDYDLLPISPQEAVRIFQEQFSNPIEMRRVVLNYSNECKTLVWNVEPNDGMRVVTLIDAYSGGILKSTNRILLVEWFDQFHELFLFGKTSKYLVDAATVFLILSLVTGWMLTKQTMRRRVFRSAAKKKSTLYGYLGRALQSNSKS
jgi:uncharacterized iron-regulated membrane protein